MRFGLCVLASALALAGCDGGPDNPPPPPPELSPADAGDPPPVAPPPPGPRPCPPFPSGYEPPADAPSLAECEAWRETRAADKESAREQERAEYVAPEFIPFAERKQHPMREGMGGWINHLTPTENGICRFAEKPRGSVPEGYMLSASSGNIDLWEEWDTLAHDHAIGFVEAGFMEASPIVAVRQGLPDLWIEPVGDPRSVILYIDNDRFVCLRSVLR